MPIPNIFGKNFKNSQKSFIKKNPKKIYRFTRTEPNIFGSFNEIKNIQLHWGHFLHEWKASQSSTIPSYYVGAPF